MKKVLFSAIFALGLALSFGGCDKKVESTEANVTAPVEANVTEANVTEANVTVEANVTSEVK